MTVSAIQSRCILYHCIPERKDHFVHEMTLQTWGESTFNDSESESNSGRLFDSESESDSSQFGYDSESNSDSSNISISDSESESDSNFQSSTDMKLLLGNFATRIESSKRFTF